ncbi:MAG: hypothetical protein AAFR93_03010, partial [Pseudomonadota bacterium]
MTRDAKLTKSDLRLAHALLTLGEFTYEDLSLSTGDSVGAIKRRLSDQWRRKGVYPFEDTGGRLKVPSGRPKIIHRLRAEAKALLEDMVDRTVPDAPVIHLDPQDLPQIDRLDTFLKDILAEGNLQFQARQIRAAEQDFTALQGQMSEDGIVVIRPSDALISDVGKLGGFVELTRTTVIQRGQTRADQISRQARRMAQSAQSAEMLEGQLAPLLDDAHATNTPLDLIPILICSADLKVRRAQFDRTLLAVIEERRAFDLLADAISASSELSETLPGWGHVSAKAFLGAFRCADLCAHPAVLDQAQA